MAMKVKFFTKKFILAFIYSFNKKNGRKIDKNRQIIAAKTSNDYSITATFSPQLVNFKLFFSRFVVKYD